jgi:uncharacterized protein YkwD
MPNQYFLGLSGPEKYHHRSILENLIWQKTNDARSEHGLSRLKFVQNLRQVAYAYSKDMCFRRFFDHVSPEGLRPIDRVTRAGITQNILGENLIMLDTNKILVRSVQERKQLGEYLVRSWMESPGHRENILTPDFNVIGVGVYVTTDDVYATQLFSG